MSSAAVINATNSSGQTAGSPVTLETAGDVVFKAFGSGAGAWSVTLAFAPSTSEAPTTLTISNDNPSNVSPVVSTAATAWVGWVQSSTGTWEASGIVEGFQAEEVLSGNLGDFASAAALPTKAIKTGARATVGAESYVYGAAGWVSDTKTTLGGVVHFIGDSITTKYNGMTWAHQIVALSKGRYIVGIDAAVGGAKIADAISVQVPKISAMNADEVWIQIGTNVSHANPVVAEEIALFDSLVSNVRAKLPRATIRVWGVPPSAIDDTMKRYMPAYNRALEVYCRGRGIFYAYGWDDVVDASGGLAVSMRVDATHPKLAAHRLCAGRRIASIYGTEPNSYQMQFTSSESGSGSVFTWDKGLMLTDSDSNGIPDIYNNYTQPSASKLARLNDGVAPIFGKVCTREMVSATSSIIDRIVNIALDASKDYEVGFYFKQDCSQESGVKMTFKSSDPGNIWGYGGGGGFNIEGYYRFVIRKEDHLGMMNFDTTHMASVYPVNMIVSYGMISIHPA